MPTVESKARRDKRQSFFGKPKNPNSLSPIKSSPSKKSSHKPNTIKELAPLSSTRTHPSATFGKGGKRHTKTKKRKQTRKN